MSITGNSAPPKCAVREVEVEAAAEAEVKAKQLPDL